LIEYDKYGMEVKTTKTREEIRTAKKRTREALSRRAARAVGRTDDGVPDAGMGFKCEAGCVAAAMSVVANKMHRISCEYPGGVGLTIEVDEHESKVPICKGKAYGKAEDGYTAPRVLVENDVKESKNMVTTIFSSNKLTNGRMDELVRLQMYGKTGPHSSLTGFPGAGGHKGRSLLMYLDEFFICYDMIDTRAGKDRFIGKYAVSGYTETSWGSSAIEKKYQVVYKEYLNNYGARAKDRRYEAAEEYGKAGKHDWEAMQVNVKLGSDANGVKLRLSMRQDKVVLTVLTGHSVVVSKLSDVVPPGGGSIIKGKSKRASALMEHASCGHEFPRMATLGAVATVTGALVLGAVANEAGRNGWLSPLNRRNVTILHAVGRNRYKLDACQRGVEFCMPGGHKMLTDVAVQMTGDTREETEFIRSWVPTTDHWRGSACVASASLPPEESCCCIS